VSDGDQESKQASNVLHLGDAGSKNVDGVNIVSEAVVNFDENNVENMYLECEIAREMPVVTVLVTDEADASTRIYDKRYFCLFCDKPYAKIKPHLLSQHGATLEVAEMMSKVDAADRNRHLTKLRNLGNHKHNCEVIRQNEGCLVVIYRPKSTSADAGNYIPCPFCYGYYEKKQLWRHCQKRCEFKT